MLNLTRWTIAHRRLVVLAWVVLAVGAIAGSQALGNRVANNFSLPNTDSQRAVDLLQSRFPAQAGDADQIVFHTTDGTLTNAATKASVTATLHAVARLPHVTRVVSPYATSGAVSRDQTTGFATVNFDKRGDALPSGAIARPTLS